MTPSPRRRSGGGPRRGAGRDRRPSIAIDPLQPTAEVPDIESFDHWPIHADVLKAIADMGISRPTPIQALSIGPVLEGRDVIAKAETGTGKTLAFGTPMISKVDPARRTVLGLVLSPTRELAEQVHNVLERLGAARKMRTALIVGGEPLAPQVHALQAGAQVVVGTPGRVLDLMGQGFLSFPWTEFAILDEADKMLEIGFIDDVKKILDACNEYRQTLLFSATFPPQLLELARTYTTDPAEIATSSGLSTVDTITQRWMQVDEDNKSRLLAAMIDRSDPDDVFLVFCDRRTDVDRLLRRMERQRFSVKALHGGYDQSARFRVMTAFREKGVKALLATDVASRGLDVVHVTHVVNFGVPRDAADYTHRIGRTGRAGRKGVAITLVSPSDRRRWTALRREVTFDIEEGDSPNAMIRPAKDVDVPPKKEGTERRPRPVRGEEAEPKAPRSRDEAEERAPHHRRDEASE
ncbi:MAG: DEAD/DEAH box helicase, partial [Planctomycetota bacterium]|nr:DEAD/DEAH box helicase [Planctomycetota bacterium]